MGQVIVKKQTIESKSKLFFLIKNHKEEIELVVEKNRL